MLIIVFTFYEILINSIFSLKMFIKALVYHLYFIFNIVECYFCYFSELSNLVFQTNLLSLVVNLTSVKG
jgi:hypothetical protein